ncbi:MAG: InlB B-repeat-containing protein [Peptococcaceae bacterium]|nr:InlB B-repeat-containing protein [Peptococcaceae bacterium]
MTTVLIMTLSGSVLTVLLLLIRPFMQSHLPQVVQYGLWLIVLVVLLIPVHKAIHLPEQASGLSLVSVRSAIEQKLAVTASNKKSTPASQTIMDSITDGVANDAAMEQLALAEHASEIPTWVATNLQIENTRLLTVLRGGIVVIYLSIAGLIMFYHFLCFAYFLGKLRYRRIAPLPYRSVLKDLCCGRRPPQLYLSPLVSTPMLAGLFRLMIVLPDRKYTDAQLKHILLHELTHLRRLDIIVKWLTIIACALHWFNPLIRLTRREIDRTCELSCDAAVVHAMNANDKKDYGRTLITLAAEARLPQAVLAVTMYEKKKNLKERLATIKTVRRYRRVTPVIFVSIFVIATIGVLGVAGSLAAGEPSAMYSQFSDTSKDPLPMMAPLEQTAEQELYTVSYNYGENGGSSATKTTETIENGRLANLTPVATKEGWQFVGWNRNQHAHVPEEPFEVSQDALLYAIYVREVTATFIDYSGMSRMEKTQTVRIYNQDTVGEVIFPQQNTYGTSGNWLAVGWTTEKGATAHPISESWSIGVDTTFYGLYRMPVIIKYNTDGGMPKPPEDVGTACYNSYNMFLGGLPMTLPSGVKKDGYEFDGWIVSGGKNKHAEGATVTPGMYATFIAQWKPV